MVIEAWRNIVRTPCPNSRRDRPQRQRQRLDPTKEPGQVTASPGLFLVQPYYRSTTIGFCCKHCVSTTPAYTYISLCHRRRRHPELLRLGTLLFATSASAACGDRASGLVHSHSIVMILLKHGHSCRAVGCGRDAPFQRNRWRRLRFARCLHRALHQVRPGRCWGHPAAAGEALHLRSP